MSLVSPDELPGLLKAIRDRAADAAPDAVMGMAETFQRHVTRVTLRRYTHSYGAKTDSPAGQPPAWVLGALARSVTAVPGPSSGMVAKASVSPHTVYARIQETGGRITARKGRYLKFRGLDGEWVYKHSVELPPRPYMEPAAKDCIANGSLTRAAADAFMRHVWV